MTTAQSLITIGIIALGTVFTRFLPFWLFPKGKPAPRIVAYLGKSDTGARFICMLQPRGAVFPPPGKHRRN